MHVKAPPRSGVAVILAAFLATSGAHAGGYNFTTIAPPPGTPVGDFVQALAINDGGQILLSALSPSTNPTTGLSVVDVDDIYDRHTHAFASLPDYPGSIPQTTLAN